jgi:tetratricopeptide (TPR) repeat protein
VLDYADRLLERRSKAHATEFLNAVIDDAQRMLDRINAFAANEPSPEAGRLLDEAYDRLGQGRLQEGVESSHRAYALQPENSTVFQRMIDIHCRAAESNATVGGYPAAMLWLRCALGHDRTNTRIHRLIADRSYLHARQLLDEARPEDALRALDECLYFDPDHLQAKAAKQKLGGGPANLSRGN